MKITGPLLYLLIGALAVACGSPSESTLSEAPDYRNLPALMGVTTQTLDSLPESGRLTKLPWSGDYWATARGGIAARWQVPTYGSTYRDHLYPIKTRSQLRRMRQADLDLLSPAEKFDLYKRDLRFSLTRSEHARVAATADSRGQIPGWYGLCHGWAPAAILEEQPGPIASVPGPNNRTINFFSADIKALITKLYADASVDHYFLGGRCNDEQVDRDGNGRVIADECRDTNPASLHLVLADYIAKQDKGFVADVTVDAQVWNQPIVGYNATLNNRRSLASDLRYTHAALGTVELVDVELAIEYVVEESPTKAPTDPSTSYDYWSYTLELDRNGFIIGGEWTSDARPDFLWQLKRKPSNIGDSSIDYASVKNLLDISL